MGVYETWVHRITAWGDDPSVSLNDLPPITEEMFLPATFDRLFKHIDRANMKIMDRWEENLVRDLSKAKTEPELARVLANSRGLLAKRVEFARNPALPEKIRETLTKEVETTIRDLQKQLEENFSNQESSTAVVRNDFLRVVKQTPLTAVLDWGGETSQVDQVHKMAETSPQRRERLSKKRSLFRFGRNI